MKLPNLSILLILFVFNGCLQKDSKKHNDTSRTDLNASETQSKEKSQISTPWLEAVKHKNPDQLKAMYAEKAIKIIAVDSIVYGDTKIADYYIKMSAEITESESLYITEANKTEGIDYELVNYKTTKAEEFVQVVIWRLKNEKRVREFEYSMKRNISNSDDYKDQVSKKRELWIQLCNEHNAEHLVSQLYTSNAIYFNHKPLVIGTKAISKEYQYMNSDTYNLSLEPLILEMVTDNTAFEIGQCKGSYGGKYVIIWKKELDGDWKVFIDSNF